MIHLADFLALALNRDAIYDERADLEIKFYFAYTSPFTYLAWAPAYALERSHRVKLRFIPYGVNICKTYGNLKILTVDRRKVRYLYLDARRIAKERGLDYLSAEKDFLLPPRVLWGPVRRTQDRFLPYSDRVFERFWKRELEVEKPDAIDAVLTEVGLDAEEFHRYVENRCARRIRSLLRGGATDRIFGVPTFMVDGEPFWGEDRVEWVIKKLDALGLRR